MAERWGALPRDEPVPRGDGWKAMPGQPKVCETCGGRVRLNKEPIWFQCSEPKRTWHLYCRPPTEAGR